MLDGAVHMTMPCPPAHPVLHPSPLLQVRVVFPVEEDKPAEVLPIRTAIK